MPASDPTEPADQVPGSGRTRLVVLFGGVSAEHDVSCVSAANVLRAVDPDRYDLVPVGITRDGTWVVSEATSKALVDGALPDRLEAEGPAVGALDLLAPSGGAGGGLDRAPTTGSPEVPGQVVVLPLLHGPMGEDGTVQGLLELAGVPYAGAGVLGSALCMDKAAAKPVVAHAGIPQCRWLSFRAGELDDAAERRVAEELGFPAFVKPANMGSSVGVARAGDADELRAALDVACCYDEVVVVEEAVDGREIEVGVLDGSPPRASVPGEVVPGAEFYDYEDKYLDGNARTVVPADLPDDVATRVRELAVAAFLALRVDGLARCDFFYEVGGRGLLLNEVNTMPGFTPVSMFPSLWAESGLAYPDLIDEVVRLALERHRRRARLRVTRPSSRGG